MIGSHRRPYAWRFVLLVGSLAWLCSLLLSCSLLASPDAFGTASPPSIDMHLQSMSLTRALRDRSGTRPDAVPPRINALWQPSQWTAHLSIPLNELPARLARSRPPSSVDSTSPPHSSTHSVASQTDLFQYLEESIAGRGVAFSTFQIGPQGMAVVTEVQTESSAEQTGPTPTFRSHSFVFVLSRNIDISRSGISGDTTHNIITWVSPEQARRRWASMAQGNDTTLHIFLCEYEQNSDGSRWTIQDEPTRALDEYLGDVGLSRLLAGSRVSSDITI